jgi:hypothetical protein
MDVTPRSPSGGRSPPGRAGRNPWPAEGLLPTQRLCPAGGTAPLPGGPPPQGPGCGRGSVHQWPTAFPIGGGCADPPVVHPERGADGEDRAVCEGQPGCDLEAMTKQTTGEEAAELLFNKPRIAVAIRPARLIQECLEVLLNHPGQDRLLGLVAAIDAPRRGHARQRRGSGTGGPFIGDRWKCRRSDANAGCAQMSPVSGALASRTHARRCREHVHRCG